MQLKAGKFIGQAARGKEKGMTQNEQAEVLDAFRRGEINVLVATSVGEEGLDFDAPIVINYEPVPDEKRMIQRRGRTGRGGPGEVYVLIGRDTGDEAINHIALRREKSMRKLIKQIREFYSR